MRAQHPLVEPDSKEKTFDKPGVVIVTNAANT
jgi:hypothetical protein